MISLRGIRFKREHVSAILLMAPESYSDPPCAESEAFKALLDPGTAYRITCFSQHHLLLDAPAHTC